MGEIHFNREFSAIFFFFFDITSFKSICTCMHSYLNVFILQGSMMGKERYTLVFLKRPLVIRFLLKQLHDFKVHGELGLTKNLSK